MSVQSLFPIHRFVRADGARIERHLNAVDLMWVALLRDSTLDIHSSAGSVSVGEHRLLYSDFEALCLEVSGDIPLLLKRVREIAHIAKPAV